MGDRERIIGDGLVLLAGSRGTRGDPEELVRLFHKGRVRQERLEKAGHCSPQWEALRSSVQQVNGTSEVRGCTIIDSPPFFASSGREERELLEEVDGRDEGLVLSRYGDLGSQGRY